MPVVLATELKKLFIKSDEKGCMTQSFFTAHHSLFVCHSSGPQIEGFGEQCKISTVSTQPNTKQDHATKMLRQAEYTRYLLYGISLQALALTWHENKTDSRVIFNTRELQRFFSSSFCCIITTWLRKIKVMLPYQTSSKVIWKRLKPWMDFSNMAGRACGLSPCTGCSPRNSVCICVCVLRLVWWVWASDSTVCVAWWARGREGLPWWC